MSKYDWTNPNQRFIERIAYTRSVEEARRAYSLPATLPEDATLSAALAETFAGGMPVGVNIAGYSNGLILNTGAVDSTPALDDAVAAAVSLGIGTVVLPRGTYRFNSQPAAPAGAVRIVGEGFGLTVCKFYGCHGFQASCDNVELAGMYIWSLDASGASDPKLYDAITYNGTSGTHINYPSVDRVFLRGWSNCINAKYTWDAAYDRVYTTNCLVGYRSFGLSGNNAISNSFIVSDTRGLSLELDGATRGEGLNVSNTLIASSATGVFADQFMSLKIVACTIDLTSVGLSLTNVTGSLVGCWVFATNDAIRFEDLASYTTGSFKVTGCDKIESTSARALYIGTFAQNVEVVHNTLKYSTSLLSVATSARHCVVEPNTVIDASDNVSQFRGGVSQTDADADFTIPEGGIERPTIYFNVALTAARTCSLPSRAASWNGRKFTVRRIGGGAVAGDLAVKEAAADGAATLKTLPNSVASSAEFEFAGLLGTPAWILTKYGLL